MEVKNTSLLSVFSLETIDSDEAYHYNRNDMHGALQTGLSKSICINCRKAIIDSYIEISTKSVKAKF